MHRVRLPPGEETGGSLGEVPTYAGYRETEPELLQNLIFGPGGLAPLSDEDFLVDLGCGQGPALLAARRAASRCRCAGVELDAEHAEIAQSMAEAEAASAGVEVEPIKVIHGSIDDCFADEASCSHENSIDLSQATVVYVFLGEWGNLKLRPRLLRTLQPGARIISKSFTMGEAWPEDAKVAAPDGTIFRLFLVTEARKAEEALMSDAELERRFGLHWTQPPPGAYLAPKCRT